MKIYSTKLTFRWCVFSEIIYSLLILLIPKAASAEAGKVLFDVSTLKSVGYPADVAKYFSAGVHFLPGIHSVSILVNSSDYYQTEAKFDSQGQLCVNDELINTLKLKKIAPYNANNNCHHIDDLWPGSTVNANPYKSHLDITLPERAFVKKDADSNVEHGGYGLIANYDLFVQRSTGRNTNLNLVQGFIESGFNFKNWIFRTRGDLSKLSNNDHLSYTSNQTYAIKAIESLHSNLSLGQISLNGNSLNGLPITGMQLYSDSNQNKMDKLLVPIQGIAETNATVEVIQRGQIIYRTVVPPGPFSLTHIGNFSNSVSTDVLIIEQDGSQKRFTIPNLQGSKLRQVENSYVVGVGRYRGIDNTNDSMLAAAELSMTRGTGISATLGTVVSAPYQSVNVSSVIPFNNAASVSASVDFSRAKNNQSGYAINLQGSSRINHALSFSVSNLFQQRNYQTADEALSSVNNSDTGQSDDDVMADDRESLHDMLGISLSWQAKYLGTFTYTFSHAVYYGSQKAHNFHTLSYGRSFGQVHVNLSAQYNNNDRMLFATISLPLGNGSLSSRVQSIDHQNSFGTTYQGMLGKQSSYSLDYSKVAQNNRLSGSISSRTSFAQMNAAYSQDSQQYHSELFSISGGMAYADNLFATSDRHIGDTFAVVSIPDQSNVAINAPGGEQGITNYWGNAIIPAVTPYNPVRVKVDTLGLPLNVRLNDTKADFILAKGSVARRNLTASQTKQVLLTVYQRNGKLAPTGASLLDKDNNFLGSIVGAGNFLLVNDDIGKLLYLELANGHLCRLDYKVPTYFDTNALYETADAHCR